MELTKQAVANIRLTCVQNKYYIAQEVDNLLDEISESIELPDDDLVCVAELNLFGEHRRSRRRQRGTRTETILRRKVFA